MELLVTQNTPSLVICSRSTCLWEGSTVQCLAGELWYFELEIFPHSLTYLNIQSPIGGSGWGILGGTALLQEACPWQQALRIKA